jgi:ATP-dependent Clp protease ATP-binding subunit ClpB
MPDKAIDLIDEAASKLRMQQESKPEAVDMLERELIRYARSPFSLPPSFWPSLYYSPGQWTHLLHSFRPSLPPSFPPRKQIEIEALKRETDAASKARMRKLEEEVAAKKEEERALLQEW